ncbi:MAG TPA: hypothetical protein VK978_00255 [Candidatus Saccharimonadales bacterium]|nr:hypothetical protein [Candidatus Saccharimonadales bacterium]
MAGLEDDIAEMVLRGDHPHFKGGSQHGMSEQRESYFMYGFEGGDCGAVY